MGMRGQIVFLEMYYPANHWRQREQADGEWAVLHWDEGGEWNDPADWPVVAVFGSREAADAFIAERLAELA